MSVAIAIIGGGIGGLALASGLRRRGISAKIYERAAEPSEISAGIAFGPNGAAAMNLLSPEVFSLMTSASTHNHQRNSTMNDSTWITFRHGAEEGKLVSSVSTLDARRTGLNSVSRAVFHNGLSELLPSDWLHFNKSLINMVKMADGRFKLQFADGSTTLADAVIGCDGIRSEVRRLLLNRTSSEEDLRFSEMVVYRSVLPMSSFEQTMGFELAHNAQMYLGIDGHILTYPINQHTHVNIVAFVHCAEWSQRSWVMKDVGPGRLKRHFQGWALPVQTIVNLMATQPIDLWAIFETDIIPTFVKENVAIMGDAAHASTPHQGAGAGQAIEDALVLTELIARAVQYAGALGEKDGEMAYVRTALADSFLAYDCIRRPRAQKVVRTSRQAGELYAFRGANGGDLETIKRDLETRFHWIWHEDLELQVTRALNVLDIIHQKAFILDGELNETAV